MIHKNANNERGTQILSMHYSALDYDAFYALLSSGWWRWRSITAMSTRELSVVRRSYIRNSSSHALVQLDPPKWGSGRLRLTRWDEAGRHTHHKTYSRRDWLLRWTTNNGRAPPPPALVHSHFLSLQCQVVFPHLLLRSELYRNYICVYNIYVVAYTLRDVPRFWMKLGLRAVLEWPIACLIVLLARESL